MLRIAAASICLILICCKEPGRPTSSLSLKDSIIREHLKDTDSLEFYDTTNYDFRALRAYINNDTSFLEEMVNDIKISKEQRRFDDVIDSCVRLKKISELDADEAYRFSHSESFCFYGQRVTISKKEHSISLHYLEYSGTPDGNTIEYYKKDGTKVKIGPGCKIEKEFLKILTAKDWDLLEGYLSSADYWGLKSHNFRLGFDGSTWTIDAYTKRPRYYTGQQVHSVHRWSPTNSFADLGRLFMNLAGEKGMCGEIN